MGLIVRKLRFILYITTLIKISGKDSTNQIFFGSVDRTERKFISDPTRFNRTGIEPSLFIFLKKVKEKDYGKKYKTSKKKKD